MTANLIKAYIKGEFPNGAPNKEVLRYLSKILNSYHRELIKILHIASKCERLFLKYRERYLKLKKKLKKHGIHPVGVKK